MGLSRRMFTKEFKLAAVQRLERGSSIGEVARALEVSPNVLHRWRREVRQGPGNVFPGHGKQRWAEGRIAELSTTRSGSRWRRNTGPWPARTALRDDIRRMFHRWRRCFIPRMTHLPIYDSWSVLASTSRYLP